MNLAGHRNISDPEEAGNEEEELEEEVILRREGWRSKKRKRVRNGRREKELGLYRDEHGHDHHQTNI